MDERPVVRNLPAPRRCSHGMRLMNCVRLAPLFAFVASLGFAADSQPELPPPEATAVWQPVPPVVTAAPDVAPSDAIILFDGKNLDAWESVKTPGKPAPWKLEDGAMVVARNTGYVRTKTAFGDIQLHLEF